MQAILFDYRGLCPGDQVREGPSHMASIWTVYSSPLSNPKGIYRLLMQEPDFSLWRVAVDGTLAHVPVIRAPQLLEAIAPDASPEVTQRFWLSFPRMDPRNQATPGDCAMMWDDRHYEMTYLPKLVKLNQDWGAWLARQASRGVSA